VGAAPTLARLAAPTPHHPQERPVSSTAALAHHDQAGRGLDQAPATFEEDAFDRLNPAFGVPADARDPAGHRAVQDREAALALGTRAAVAISRENEPDPLVRVAGQDDRVATAVRTGRQRPERTAPER
jgi:hypothetical protein